MADTMYSILGLEEDASADAVKQKYHEMALKHHPDRNRNQNDKAPECKSNDADNGQNTAMFFRVQEAWEILKDPQKRKAYDKELKERAAKQQNVAISFRATLNECDLIDQEMDDDG